MNLPIRTFWEFSKNVDRIMASEDIRDVAVLVSSAPEGGGPQDLMERLIAERGMVIKTPIGIDVERDEIGFAELKAMASGE